MVTYYTENHEWITVDGETATVGITEHAAELLGDIVFIEQKDVGENFEKGDEIGLVESVKAASEIFAPVSCEIVSINEELAETPSTINDHPEKEGWMFTVKISDKTQLDELLSESAYKASIS